MDPTNVIESNPILVQDLLSRFGESILYQEATKDSIPTLWITKDRILDVLAYLRQEVSQPFRTLYDLTAVDERMRRNRQQLPPSDFTVVYTLLSYERNADIRLKVPLIGETPSTPSCVRVYPVANWYEREVWDMFGVRFDGHPHLTRILMPPHWVGHPLRKEHPARATEMGPFTLPDEKQDALQEALQFDPAFWGLQKRGEDTDFIFLNLGPQHPGTHGVLRLVLQLSGEEVLDVIPEIGFHHRGAEKMGERQTWHTYIPYTDRVDYLGGVMNNFPYVLAVEKLAGIEVPERAQVIRVMMAEFFRLSSHLVWYGTFAQDIGQLSPVFYMFTDREKVLEFVAAVTGFRMHPAWFRIGGTAADLPEGWDKLVREFLDYFPKRLDDYSRMVMDNKIFQARTKGIGAYTLDEAIEWGVTGPNLRACGMEWDFRKKRPYSMYDQFDFEIPTATHGDCYDRAVVRVEEMRQSVRIIEQCLNNMPSGPYKSDHPRATPPRKPKTMHDIETLINHFLNVSWGPVIPPGEALGEVEATKGNNGYYLVSDGGTESYRTRIRTPSFAHIQTVPFLAQGTLIADVLAILGSMDFVLADVDR